jgi:FHA domain/Domain of unknown function (DUF1707)
MPSVCRILVPAPGLVDNSIVIDTPLPGSIRASDEDRERTARRLRDGVVAGRMSTDTFARRVELAYGARHQAELEGLRRDLPRRWPLDLMTTTLGRLSAGVRELRAAWEGPRVPRLTVPGSCNAIVVGRSTACDFRIDEPTVSRRHAELRRTSHGWLITDLGSLNGLRVNGLRVREAPVAAGDVIDVGGVRLVFEPS